MIEPLNNMGITVACIGNHELDYDLNRVNELTSKNNFKWLMTNIHNKITNENLLENAIESFIFIKNGIKIGVIGLAEEEWMTLITDIS